MSRSDERLPELRTQIESLLAQYAAIEGEREGVFLHSWVVAYEYTTAELDADGNTADDVIVPSTQARSTTRGLLHLALDHFTRAT